MAGRIEAALAPMPWEARRAVLPEGVTFDLAALDGPTQRIRCIVATHPSSGRRPNAVFNLDITRPYNRESGSSLGLYPDLQLLLWSKASRSKGTEYTRPARAPV